MASFKISVLVVLFVVLFNPFVNGGRSNRNRNSNSNSKTLKLVHLLFRHGERTTDPSTTYPKDPYRNATYYPYGWGQLTNEGRKTEFLLGKKLRRRYNSFLGTMYTPDILEAVSTQIDRTKASLQLVLAGLFPPRGTMLDWNMELNWQPIPFRSLDFDKSPLLTLPHEFCPAYAEAYKAYLNSKEGNAVEQKYGELYPYLSEHTGLDVKSTFDLRLLYYGLATQDEWGFDLPMWSKRLFPEVLENGTIDFFTQSGATPQLKQLSGGFLLKKIIDDSERKLSNQLTPENRKLFLYSAHEFNLAFFLNTMEVFFHHSPPYGSCVIIEVHTINDVDGIKIFYEDYSGMEPRKLTIPGCDHFCPFHKFVSLLRNNLPQEKEGDVCRQRRTSNSGKESS